MADSSLKLLIARADSIEAATADQVLKQNDRTKLRQSQVNDNHAALDKIRQQIANATLSLAAANAAEDKVCQQESQIMISLADVTTLVESINGTKRDRSGDERPSDEQLSEGQVSDGGGPDVDFQPGRKFYRSTTPDTEPPDGCFLDQQYPIDDLPDHIGRIIARYQSIINKCCIRGDHTVRDGNGCIISFFCRASTGRLRNKAEFACLRCHQSCWISSTGTCSDLCRECRNVHR